MDDMDLQQDAAAAQQEARMAAIRAQAALMAVPPPKSRMCSDCGNPIPAKRLKAVPTAVYCVDCLEELERHRP